MSDDEVTEHTILCLTILRDRNTDTWLFTGQHNGEIKGYSLTYQTSNLRVDLAPRSTLGRGRAPVPVTFLKGLSRDRLLSSSWECSRDFNVTIWDIHSNVSTTLNLSGCIFWNRSLGSATELQNNLLAICGSEYNGHTGNFQVFDLETYRPVYRNRGNGKCLVTTANGYLAVLSNQLAVWRVSREECVQLGTHDCQSGQPLSLLALSSGEVLVGGIGIEVYEVDAQGSMSLCRVFQKETREPQPIYRLMPLGGYAVLSFEHVQSVDHKGTFRRWDLLKDEPNFEELGSLGQSFGAHCDRAGLEDVIPSTGLLVYAKGPTVLQTRALQGRVHGVDPLAELRKNARLLSAAKRGPLTHGFALLPTEILVRIIALSGQNFKVGWNEAYQVAMERYGNRV